MHVSRIRTALAGVLVAGVATSALAATSPSSSAAGAGFSARVILNAKAHGWTAPDDVTRLGGNLYVGFQNGVGSMGEPSSTGKVNSTLVELATSGRILKTWALKGKIDGLGADPAINRVLVTVNEDGNSSLYTVAPTGAVAHYTYSIPLPSKGGTDAISVFQGQIYTTASNPTGLGSPTLYRIVLSGHTAQVLNAKVRDDSGAFLVNNGANTPVRLALTDPDSVSVVPADAPRFRNQFMIDAQGDQEAIFVNEFTQPGTVAHVLKLSQSIDDTAFATQAGGTMVVTDAKADTVDLVTGPFAAGAAYSVVTPGNSNNAPANPVPNYLGKLNLTTGALTPLVTTGAVVVPHGMIYIP